ncbi:MAG TPA: type II secretion system F family protein [Bryobacteraceae bacterium]|jgi:tight adherence protein B|nr:type II secretion system F family protein [Bryobacteraceae bacterium]
MRAFLPLFLALFTFVLLAVALGLKFYEWWRQREMSAILLTAVEDPRPGDAPLLRNLAGKRPQLEVWLERLALLEKIKKLVQQAGVNWTPGGLVLRMAGAAAGAVALARLLPAVFAYTGTTAALAALLAALPYLYLRRKRARRSAAFEEQFPEALDFLARSMRAGHAFTISLRMASEDMPDPMGFEFRTLFNEQNLGAPLDTALYNLAERVPLLDVRFFVSAVILQKQTGGNLGEILTRLAQVIRQRFQLKGQVKAASAHGRITALVLTILPAATCVLMMMAAPAYLKSMFDDPDGKKLIAGSIVGQIVGQLVIRKIIRIKV